MEYIVNPIQKKMQALLLVAAAIPATVYFLVIWNVSFNIPEGDSYLDQLFVIIDFSETKGWREGWSALSRQYIAHSHFLSRLVPLVEYIFTGKVDFRLLNIFGVLPQCGILYYLYRCEKDLAFHTTGVLAYSLLIFTFYPWDISTWGMCGLAYGGTVFLAFLCFYYLDQASPKIFFALICAFLSMYTMANGLLSLVIGSAILFYNFKNKKNISIFGLVWWCFGVLFLLIPYIYFRDFLSSSMPGSGKIDLKIEHLFFYAPIDFFASIGGFFLHAKTQLELKAGIGLFVISAGVYFIWLSRKSISFPVLGLIIFSAASLFSVSVFKYSSVSTMTGFKIYSSFVYAAIMFFVIFNIKNKYISHVAIVIFLVLMNVRGYLLHINDIKMHQNGMREEMIGWLTGKEDTGINYAGGFIRESIRTGIYNPLTDEKTMPLAGKPEVISVCPSFPAKNIMSNDISLGDSKKSIAASFDFHSKYDVRDIYFCGNKSFHFEYHPKEAHFQKKELSSILIEKTYLEPGIYDIYVVDALSNHHWILRQHEVYLAEFDDFKDYCQNVMGPVFFQFDSFLPVKKYFCGNARQ